MSVRRLQDFQELLARRLLAWGALSALAGGALIWRGDPFWRAFGVQALAWGAVDAAIALFAQWRARRHPPMPERAGAEAYSLRRLLWINTGLDVLYVSGGLLLALTLGTRDSVWQGRGWGVIIQGGFLLAFDLIHARLAGRLPERA
jgi:hypothetical protein